MTRRRWLPPLLLVALASLLYGNSLGNGYSVDDYYVIEDHEQATRGIAAIPDILTTNFIYHGDEGANFRPIPRISFAVGYELFGPNPHVGHLSNLLLYCLTGILVMTLMQAMFPSAPRFFPVTVALLFLAHPIHTEVVASLKNRDELMASLFGLLSLSGFLGYYRRGGAALLALGTVSFLCALLSKESSHQFLAVLPVVLFFGGGWNLRRMATSLALAMLATLAFWAYVVSFLDQARILYMAGSEGFNYLEHPLMFVEEFSTRYGTALYSMGYYLRLLAFPHPLSIFYGYGAIPLVDLGNGWAILSLLVYSALAAFALLRFRSRSIPAFAILYFLGTFAVFSNLLVPMQGIVAERYIYAASLGFCIGLGWVLSMIPIWAQGWTQGARAGRAAAAVALAAILALYGAKTIDRNRDWESHFTLVERDAEQSPDTAMIHALAFKLYHERSRAGGDRQAREQEMRRAIAHLSEVSRIAPAYRPRVSFLAGVLQLHVLEAPRDAVASFQDALAAAQADLPIPEPEMKVDSWAIELKLAESYARLEEREQARDHLRRSIAAYNAASDEPIAPTQLEGLSLAESIARVTNLIDPR